MSYKVSFLDNQVCGVDDFNAILGDIAQEGVVTNDFDKTSIYQMSKMNVVTQKVISQGVSERETSLACSVGMKDEDNGIYVAPGIGIFGSGARIKVESSEFVSFGGNENGYVYAYHDMKNNMAGFMSSSEGFPAEVEGEFYILKLCSVVGGVFADKREYAKANIKVCDTVNAVKKMLLSIPNEDYSGQKITILSASDKTKLNFLFFVTSEGIYFVEETSYGEFRIIDHGQNTDNVHTVVSVSLWKGTGSNYARLTNFERDANGNICAKVDSGLLNSKYQYLLYASVYEEVDE